MLPLSRGTESLLGQHQRVRGKPFEALRLMSNLLTIEPPDAGQSFADQG